MIPVTESRPHAEEVLPGILRFHRALKPEKSVVFDSALPQVLGCLLVVKPNAQGHQTCLRSTEETIPENKRVLLFSSLVVVLNNHNRKLLLLEIKLRDLWPEKYKLIASSTLTGKNDNTKRTVQFSVGFQKQVSLWE